MEHIRLRETQQRSLGYAPEFRQMTAEHPGVLESAMRLAQQAEDKYKPRNVKIGRWEFGWAPAINQFETVKWGKKRIKPELRVTYGQRLPVSRGVLFSPGKTLRDKATGLEVTALGISKREFATGLFGTGAIFRIDDTAYFRMKLGDESFFVKKSRATDNPGYDEFKNSHVVRTALSSMDDLEVVDSQLGYNDGHQSWFVSRWKNLEESGFFPINTWDTGSPNDYGKSLRANVSGTQEWLDLFKWETEVKAKAEVITDEMKKRLEGSGIKLQDVLVNLFYNPETNKYFLLDVTTEEKTKGIGQPPQFHPGK